MLLAARAIIEKGKRIASNLLEADEHDVDYKPGEYSVAGTDRNVSFLDVVRASFDLARLPPREKLGLDESSRYEREDFNYPNGYHICEVEIDLVTCVARIANYTVVDDFGRIINPLIVRGQVIGGVVQGIGQALLENTSYDASGQLRTASFMDYCLPRADNLLPINVTLYENAPTNTNSLGERDAGRLARRDRLRRWPPKNVLNIWLYIMRLLA